MTSPFVPHSYRMGDAIFEEGKVDELNRRLKELYES